MSLPMFSDLIHLEFSESSEGTMNSHHLSTVGVSGRGSG